MSKEMVDDMLSVAREFFNLPVEEKMKLYSDEPSKTTRLSTSFNVKKEKVRNWRDYLRLDCHPLAKFVPIGLRILRLSMNADKPRLSIASFLCPCDGARISAPKGLMCGESRTLYRDFTYAEYYDKFWSRNLDQDHCLELFKN
ncbi:2-oxoglutarate (2OG) and Fe(II)-dependent oxygenase superfamily protein [Striga hermonthica]|uniref:2-oxoglutarate (2OG) and Fe(II)-dependent oxygenase superfamily protein n=1 Tax=Striga hermonthica TaxID=68872 RepID=A0A9N7N2B3_STRHE|nr:2-oxoglutarate (2OG) and Fe(II)-dependent oxygenase superfamily protein [Striga hermonthica]